MTNLFLLSAFAALIFLAWIALIWQLRRTKENIKCTQEENLTNALLALRVGLLDLTDAERSRLLMRWIDETRRIVSFKQQRHGTEPGTSACALEGKQQNSSL